MNYTIISCINCDQKLRVPANRGILILTCPSCKLKWKWEPYSNQSEQVNINRSPNEIGIQESINKITGEILNDPSLNIKKEVREQIIRRINEIKNYIPKFGIFGKTGVGKSSLCNALFGADVSPVSDIAACTREPKEFLIKLASSDNKGLILMDCPGIGETPEIDEEYKALYNNLIPELDLILWVLDARERAYGPDIAVYRELLAKSRDNEKVIFTINKVDGFKPYEWNIDRNSPGKNQQKLIGDREKYVSEKFPVALDKICSISVEKKYNLGLLVELIVATVPNEKKYSFVREANAENITKKAQEYAKKGFFEALWDGLKNTVSAIGETYDKYKETINSAVTALFNFWATRKGL